MQMTVKKGGKEKMWRGRCREGVLRKNAEI